MAPGDAACEVQSAPSKRHIVATSQYAMRARVVVLRTTQDSSFPRGSQFE